ncbi:MAG: DUF4062 domain-containing protein [Pseudomonadota bacterium]
MAYRVFLSSTAADLDDWRTAVKAQLDLMDNVKVVWMRDWMANPQTARKVCEEKVRTSRIFVGLIGHCFGSAPASDPDRSYTMLEHDWASGSDLPVLMQTAPDDFPVPNHLIEKDRERALQATFRASLEVHRGQSASWMNPQKLAADVAEAVRQQIVRIDAERQKGFTRDKHEVSLLDRLNEITVAIASAPQQQADLLRTQRGEIEGQLRGLERSFADAQAIIVSLKDELRRESNELDAGRLTEALAKLDDGHLDDAKALLHEISDRQDLAVQRKARAEFGLGEIAEKEVRWLDAADHYKRAADLAKDTERLEKAGEYLRRAGRSAEAVRYQEGPSRSAIRGSSAGEIVTSR